MIPRANIALWPRPFKRTRLSLASTFVVSAVAALILAQYLAGYLFLWWVRLNPREASPLTVARYAYYYGHRDDLRRRLAI